MKTRILVAIISLLTTLTIWGQNPSSKLVYALTSIIDTNYLASNENLTIKGYDPFISRNLYKNDVLGNENNFKKNKSSKRNDKKDNLTSRISFVIGFGVAEAFKNTYQLPVVSSFDNKVRLEEGQKERINGTLGIVYTPYLRTIHDAENPDGIVVPRGISFVAFFNPLSVVKNSNLEDNFSLSNFGLGVGYKTVTGFGIYGVFELYSIKQPRQWFIDEFKNGDKVYKVNEEIQSSFSENDNNIFISKLVPSIGVKICYSFDIIRSFASSKEK